MTTETVIEICTEGLLVILYVIGPPLAAAMAVGLFVAVMQAATQIQEASLTFVPKLAAIGITLLFTGRWSLAKLTAYMNEIVEKMTMVGS